MAGRVVDSPRPSRPIDPPAFAAPPDHIAAGILLRIAGAATFSLMSAMLKLASEGGVVPAEMLFYRALFGIPVVLAWVMRGPGLRALGTQRPLAHLARSALGIGSILCTFQALVMLPLSHATIVGFTAPVFATILSGLLLGERIGRHRWIAVAAGFAGMAVVFGPDALRVVPLGPPLPLAGVGFGLAAALGTAGVTIALRRLGDTEEVGAIVFWFFACSLVVGALLLPAYGHWHAPGTFAALVLAGVAGGVMQLCMTASLGRAPVAVLSPFDYLQIVGTLLLSWAIWAHGPGLETLAGAALIAGAGLYTGWREHRQHRDPPVPPSQPLT